MPPDDKKTSDLPVVTTPAGTDEIAVNQGGVSKRMTLAQVHTNDVHAGWSRHANIATPAAAPIDTLYYFARKICNRMMPKWMPPSGVDTPFQPALFGNNIMLYTPSSGTTVTGGFGTLWAKGSGAGTVSHPTPAATAPAIVNQMKRTRHVNAATTANQVMGIISTATGMSVFWRGNAAGLGGFFFFARFIIELWPADTARLFVGLTAGTAEVAASDVVANNTIGLWHDTTDGANALCVVRRDAATTSKAETIAGATLAAGQAFDFYMFARPNDSEISYRLDSVNNNATIQEGVISSGLPANTAFLGPQVTMSNGTANVTVTTVGIGVNRVYVEADR